jgi:tetratricopeptide (TPR) repeat protein
VRYPRGRGGRVPGRRDDGGAVAGPADLRRGPPRPVLHRADRGAGDPAAGTAVVPAAELAGQFVRAAAGDGTALLARARTRAVFHRFTEALADLQAAEERGLDRATVAAERAEILQATGSQADAGELHRYAARRRPGFATLGALAVFQAERGELAAGEHLFAEARQQYQGTSPFPIASLDYRRGLMWRHAGNLLAARTWLDASLRRVPAYAPALGRLAEIDSARGDHQAAVDRLRLLASASDDPGYAATLARALDAAGQRRAAAQRPGSGVLFPDGQVLDGQVKRTCCAASVGRFQFTHAPHRRDVRRYLQPDRPADPAAAWR